MAAAGMKRADSGKIASKKGKKRKKTGEHKCGNETNSKRNFPKKGSEGDRMKG